jgi:hypothetical protein
MTTYLPIFSGIFRGGAVFGLADDFGADTDMTRTNAKNTDRITFRALDPM